MPFAQSLTPGNHPPTVALQATFPNPARAGAPILVRATVRDADVDGAVAGVWVRYRVAGGAFGDPIAMTKDQSVNAADSYQAIIPASFTNGLPIGTNLDYYVQATDNLGASTATPVVFPTIPLTHSYNHSLTATPNPLAITSGYSRLHHADRARRSQHRLHARPHSATLSANLGTIGSNSSSGVAFTAGKIGGGSVTLTVGGDTIAVPVTVSTARCSRSRSSGRTACHRRAPSS